MFSLSNNILPFLLIGILFVIIGCGILIFRKKQKIAGLIPLGLGLTAILLTTIGPLSKSQDHIDSVLQLEPKEVARVIIDPTPYNSYENVSITRKITTISDRKMIDNLCLALSRATTTSSIIKYPQWELLVSFEKFHRSVLKIAVKKAGTATMVEVKSNGHTGWNYGTLEANAFGEILPGLVR